MGGLDDYKAVSSPEVGEWAIAFQGRQVVRPPMAVRKKDDGQVSPGRRSGNSNLQVDDASRG